MSKKYNYNQLMNIKYENHEVIDIPQIVKECTDQWFNQTLTKVNDSVVRIGVFEEDEYHWHKHDNDDEFFFVLSGKLFIELEDKTIELNKNEGTTISKGVMHKPRVSEKTVVLMVETAEIDPIGE